MHSEFNAAKVAVATAATLVKDIFEQTGMHDLKTIEQHFDRDDAKSATYYSGKIPLDNCLLAFEAIANEARGGSSQILNMRVQYILHGVVAIGRMTHKSDRGHLQLPPRLHPQDLPGDVRRGRKASLWRGERVGPDCRVARGFAYPHRRVLLGVRGRRASGVHGHHPDEPTF